MALELDPNFDPKSKSWLSLVPLGLFYRYVHSCKFFCCCNIASV